MSPAHHRPALLAAACLGLSILAAHALQITLTTLALGPGPLWEALGAGSYAGQRPLAAVVQTAALAVLALLLAGTAIAAPAPAGLARSPWSRLLAVLAPLLITPWVLTQDDTSRRPALLAFLLASSVATAVWLRGRAATRAAATGWREHAPMLALIALHGVVFSYLAITRDRALWSATVDLGLFKEALWHTLHGRPMYSPTVGYSFLGEHFSPVLFLLAPLYAVSHQRVPAARADPRHQRVGVAGVPPRSRARPAARPRELQLAGAMIFSPQMHVALLYDFHMDLLAVPALCALALAVHRRRWGAAALAAALAVSVKEDMFIPAVGVLLARALDGDARDRRRAGVLAAVVVAYCLVAMSVLLKRFGPPPGVPVYMADGTEGTQYKFLRNFRHLATPMGPLLTLLGQPVRFALYALSEARLSTLLSFVLPLALLHLAAGLQRRALDALGIVLLSDNPRDRRAGATTTPRCSTPGCTAAVYGAARLLRGDDAARRSDALRAFVLAASCVMALTHRAWPRGCTPPRARRDAPGAR
ncbi:MAG: DUF2079 domain-containing protein [Polyangiales bacterium]